VTYKNNAWGGIPEENVMGGGKSETRAPNGITEDIKRRKGKGYVFRGGGGEKNE